MIDCSNQTDQNVEKMCIQNLFYPLLRRGRQMQKPRKIFLRWRRLIPVLIRLPLTPHLARDRNQLRREQMSPTRAKRRMPRR
jgi:hypothetical protein